MKKLSFTLLLLVAAFALKAQNTVKADITDYLRTEGYLPAYDEDGDIRFKVQGNTYLAFVKQVEGKDYAYVEIVLGIASELPIDKLTATANRINQDKYICKCSAFEGEESNVFQVSYEFITGSAAQTEFQVMQMLRLMPSWVEEFSPRLEE